MMKAILEGHPSGEIRGRALECAGVVALAIKENFLPYIEYFLNGTISALNNENMRDEVELYAFRYSKANDASFLQFPFEYVRAHG